MRAVTNIVHRIAALLYVLVQDTTIHDITITNSKQQSASTRLWYGFTRLCEWLSMAYLCLLWLL